MNRIVTISFTTLDAPGGVPKFNRDLHAAFPDRETIHFSWWDFPWSIEMEHLPEWEKARTLNHYLVSSRKLLPTDVVIADGFWADGLQHMKLAVSHSHGIWSHLTKEDTDAGKAPDMPYHHAAQVNFRRRWTDLKKHITAVSDFIAVQMELQWGFKVDKIINNGVDTNIYRPLAPVDYSDEKYEVREFIKRDKPIVVHGVNDKGNINKGWDHIQALIDDGSMDVCSLDELAAKLNMSKPDAMAQATIMVHPSGYEGNSMFVAEAMACGIPIVGYDVGFLYKVRDNGFVGYIIPRSERRPEVTLVAAKQLTGHAPGRYFCSASVRSLALKHLSLDVFKKNWREYVEEIEK